ncbi:MAG: pyridoxal phosphate-dependent aminotransferase [Clostridiales bacterium]|nr:pyridoxal phosphate-dependent aminotransferase [Clostridiales bacterium]
MNLDTLVDRKNTDCVKWDALQEVYGRDDVLPLWIADMDFKSSPKIIEALIKRAEHGVFGYPTTPKSVFKPFIEWNAKRNGLGIDEEWILTCPGVAVAFSIGVQAYTKEGDGVMIQTPVYPPFHSAVKNNNRIMVENELVEKDGYYTINFDDFERKIIDNNVKLFILCNPHNPVGRVWKKEELEKMADICLKHDVKIFSDEIHSDLIFKGKKFVSALSLDGKYKKILITAMAPSKTFNIPGLYSSIVLIPDKNMMEDYKKVSDGLAIGEITIFGLTAMEASYKHGEEWLANVMEYIEDNAEYLDTFIKENMPEIKYRKPEGTYLGWLDFRNVFSTQEELDDFLINKAKIGLNSGETFGRNGEGFARINLGCQRAILIDALNRIKNALYKG